MMFKRLPHGSLLTAVISNMAGRAWGTIISIAFVPMYLQFLGPEGYGIVGFGSTLLAIVGFLDCGLTLTVNRELARLSHPAANVPEMQRTLSAATGLFLVMSALIATAIWLGAPLIASRWLNANVLTVGEITRSIRLIGLVLAEQLLISLYQGALFGINRQEIANFAFIAAATARAVGAIVVLKFVAPTPSAFFSSYALVSLIYLIALLLIIASLIPMSISSLFRHLDAVAGLLRRTAGFGTIAILSLLLSQIDKLLISRLLPLADFGYYMTAVSVALLPLLISSPITSAVFPRLARLAAHEPDGAVRLFHLSVQVVGIFVVPIGITFALFSREIIFAWTGSETVTIRVAPLLTILISGYTINASIQMTYHFEMAFNRTRLIIRNNIIALFVILPGIVIFSREYGAAGAASCWLALNIGYLFLGVPSAMYRSLGKDLRRLYLNDLAPPYLIATMTVGAARFLVPDGLPRVSAGIAVLPVLGVSIAACVLAMTEPRLRALHSLQRLYLSVTGPAKLEQSDH